MSAIITISIIFCVEILSRLCGDDVTIKLLKVSTLSIN
jgi:chemotaxis protein CheY-P-specific phosphatase CheC